MVTIQKQNDTYNCMPLLKELDADWCNLRPSRPTAKLCIGVRAKSVDMSRLNKNATVLWTEGYVKDAMSCQHSDHSECHHFTNLTLCTYNNRVLQRLSINVKTVNSTNINNFLSAVSVLALLLQKANTVTGCITSHGHAITNTLQEAAIIKLY